MSVIRFIDTNVLIRYLSQDDPRKAEQGRALLERIDRGDEEAAISHLVLFEVVFLLQKTYRLPRKIIREMVSTLLLMRNLHVPDRQVLFDALALFEERNISFADAYNAVYMQREGLNQVYSWDAEFDRVPWPTRIEPSV